MSNKKTSDAVKDAADAETEAALSQASQTEPRDDAPPADNDHVAAGAEQFADPRSDELLRAHQRINELVEDIAFLRATYGWPTKDRT